MLPAYISYGLLHRKYSDLEVWCQIFAHVRTHVDIRKRKRFPRLLPINRLGNSWLSCLANRPAKNSRFFWLTLGTDRVLPPQGSAMMPPATCSPRRKVVLVSLFLALHQFSHEASAFLSHPSSVSGSKFFHVTKARSTTSHSVAINPMSPSREAADSITIASQSFFLSPDEVNPIIRIGNGEKEKVINSHGLWCAAVSLMTGPVWMAAMMMVELMYKLDKENQDTHRALFDSTGKVWSKIWLTLTDSYPTFSGDIDKLRAGRHGPCLYVANHASWLDIPVLCTVLDPVFKFIAKGELRSVPCIGQQLAGVSTSVSAQSPT
jgi:Acyltransferase